MTTVTRSSSTRQRRRRLIARLQSVVVLVVGLVALGAVYAALAPAGRADTNTPAQPGDPVVAGHALFLRGCSSCHGLTGEGGSEAPSLVGVGAAAVDFQVGTGRMPLATFDAQAVRKQPKFSPQEIQELAAYVASLGPGPAIPTNQYVNGYTKADVAKGGEIFRTNCSQCHNAIGEGGSLGYGVYAPALTSATPKQMIEAMETGPEQMPVFSDTLITPSEKLDVVRFLVDVNKKGNAVYTAGGHPIGRIGPVSEGAVAWIVGIGACVLFTLWIGSRIS